MRFDPSRRAALAGALGVGAAATGFGALGVVGDTRPPPGKWAPRTIVVNAAPLTRFSIVEPELRRFGALQFLSGLTLTSSEGNFGGFSGLHLAGGAGFTAVSDVGFWLVGRLGYDAAGAMHDLTDTRLMPVLGPNGRPLAWSGRWDCESLAMAPDGSAYVGIERIDEIYKFDFAQAGPNAKGALVGVPAWFRDLPKNKGVEALSVAPPGTSLAGALLMIAERSHGHGATTAGALIGGPRPGDLRFARRDDFDVSDCAFLPGGDLLVLERRFRWTDGVAIRLRRVAGGDIRPGATLQGEHIFSADMRHEVDNMEGLAVHTDAQRRTIVTMISDDNFSIIQRTLLLQFRLDG